MASSARFVEIPSCFIRLIILIGALILIIPALIWSIGIVRAMNMAQLAMSDVELHAYAENIWATSQLRLLEIDGMLCTPPQSMFLPVVHATVNNQLVEAQLETPYGAIDSSADSPYSACLTEPLPTQGLSFVRVVMYQIHNPFGATLYEWAVKDGSPTFPPIITPPGPNTLETRAYNLWHNPQAEDGIFQTPWIKEVVNKTSVVVCFGMSLEESSWIEASANGRTLEMIERSQRVITGDNDQPRQQATACFRMLVYPGRMLLQIVAQNSPTGYEIHQWGVEVVYDDYFYKQKACLAVSQATLKCFSETQK